MNKIGENNALLTHCFSVYFDFTICNNFFCFCLVQEWVANYWVFKGAPRDKINIGLALYGRGFRLANPRNTKPGAPAAGPSRPANFTRESGIQAYYEVIVCNFGLINQICHEYLSGVSIGLLWKGVQISSTRRPTLINVQNDAWNNLFGMQNGL